MSQPEDPSFDLMSQFMPASPDAYNELNSAVRELAPFATGWTYSQGVARHFVDEESGNGLIVNPVIRFTSKGLEPPHADISFFPHNAHNIYGATYVANFRATRNHPDIYPQLSAFCQKFMDTTSPYAEDGWLINAVGLLHQNEELSTLAYDGMTPEEYHEAIAQPLNVVDLYRLGSLEITARFLIQTAGTEVFEPISLSMKGRLLPNGDRIEATWTQGQHMLEPIVGYASTTIGYTTAAGTEYRYRPSDQGMRPSLAITRDVTPDVSEAQSAEQARSTYIQDVRTDTERAAEAAGSSGPTEAGVRELSRLVQGAVEQLSAERWKDELPIRPDTEA